MGSVWGCDVVDCRWLAGSVARRVLATGSHFLMNLSLHPLPCPPPPPPPTGYKEELEGDIKSECAKLGRVDKVGVRGVVGGVRRWLLLCSWKVSGKILALGATRVQLASQSAHVLLPSPPRSCACSTATRRAWCRSSSPPWCVLTC